MKINCDVLMPYEAIKKLGFNQYQKSDKTICYLCRSWVSNKKDWWM